MANVRSGMRSKVGLFLAGLIVGALLLTIVPVGAHHNDTKFKNRLTALETKVTKLTKKTSNLSADGDNYQGFVHSAWIVNHINTGCTDNESAQWMPDEGDFVWLGCPGATLPASADALGGIRTRR